MKTKIINFISGPSVGKSLFTSHLFVKLKENSECTEIISEYAKTLVWQERFEELNNQYEVSFQQYKLFNSLNGKVDYIVTDGSLIHGLAYNLLNKDNVSNTKLTELKIIEWFNKFENINIFLERNENINYEVIGRIEDFSEAKNVDKLLLDKLDEFNIKYTKIKSDLNNTKEILDYIYKT